MNQAFKLFFRGLARHAPGTDEDTLNALESCELPDNPIVWDMGAGTGSSTLLLAEELDGEVTAVDLMADSLKTLDERAERRGLDNIRTLEADFTELEVAPESVDLIWSEGSVYAIGWERAVSAWGPILKPGGYIVASDCIWTTDERPAEAVEFWKTEYPGMSTAKELREKAKDAGFEVVDSFEMHRTGWLDYYGPIRQRTQLFGSSNTSEEMDDVIDAMSNELEVFEAHGHSWNYVFLVLRKP